MKYEYINISDLYWLSNLGNLLVLSTERNGDILGISLKDENAYKVFKDYEILEYKKYTGNDREYITGKFILCEKLRNPSETEKFWYINDLDDKKADFFYGCLLKLAYDENDVILENSKVSENIDVFYRIYCDKIGIKHPSNIKELVESTLRQARLNSYNNCEILEKVANSLSVNIMNEINRIKIEENKTYL